MPTNEQRVPNNPLTGAELKAVCLKHVRELLMNTEIDLITAIEDRMAKDQLFAPRPYTHPRCRVEIQFRFHWSNRNLPKTEFLVVAGQTDPQAEDVVEFISGTNREFSIESPNLERLAAGLPITQVESVKPKPGEMFGSFNTTEIPVNAEEYPKPKPPIDEDTTEFIAADLKIPEHKRIRSPKKQRGGPK
jgi:hypothetical protein